MTIVSRQIEFVRMRAFRLFLILVAAFSGLASALLFALWIPMAGGLLLAADLSSPVAEAVTAYETGNFPLFLFILRSHFAAIGGLLGWIALFALCILARRNWDALPKWIPIGCALGAVAVLIGPYAYVLAIPPITLAATVLLLIKCRASDPAHSGESTELDVTQR
ncbi:hypothetical protein [Paracidovorax sp. MALMAid1276]|uniref:hypothetical protein n=1 Tax=Paracidovorax sp. MALMAid1276 TaxID=3411631 RepID=UPI003B9D8520